MIKYKSLLMKYPTVDSCMFKLMLSQLISHVISSFPYKLSMGLEILISVNVLTVEGGLIVSGLFAFIWSYSDIIAVEKPLSFKDKLVSFSGL